MWGVYTVGIAIYLGDVQRLSLKASGWVILQKVVATVTLIWGILLIVGAGFGEHNMFKPLPKMSITVAGGTTANTKHTSEFPFENIANITAYEIKRRQAMDEGKTMIIYFYTDTCPVCKHLKDTTYKNARVQEKLNNDYIAVSVNMSDGTDKKISALKKKFQVFGPPGFVFLDSDGKIMEDEKFYGYQEPDEFYDTLDLIAE